jgi:hypothetical protein
MGIDLVFGYPTWFAQGKSYDELPPQLQANWMICLGSSSAWPLYWRPFLLAVYRRLQAEPDSAGGHAALIQAAIVECCPPGGWPNPNRNEVELDPRAELLPCNLNAIIKHRQLLELANVDCIVDFALLYKHHWRTALTAAPIRKAGAQLPSLVPYLPEGDAWREGTPYVHKYDYDTVDKDERYAELAQAFAIWALEPCPLAVFD